SGETDLRGLFIADGIQGTTTVIARKDQNLYAFYRGDKVLGQVPNAPANGEAAQQKPAEGQPQQDQGQSGGKGKLLENIKGDNYRYNADQRGQFNDLINNTIKGVKAKGAY
ncbi:MAG: hypothetical protein KDA84_06585, partial [Planctomycetaceae bacterium]|nr:hypothetical protein [Planctomycetaceae bacterium]